MPAKLLRAASCMILVSDMWRRNAPACVALLIAIVVAIRIAVVIATPAEIGPDEAQYWRWSEKLDFGYYSKPPLVAWVIAATTSIFGDSGWAIRLSAPILHGIGAWFLFLLGKRAFDVRVGAWSAAFYLMMPGIVLSSTIMSTDAVLLPTTGVALYFLWRFRDEPGYLNAVLAGASVGLAMLAKYAALYLYPGAVLAAFIDRDMRKALLSPAGAVALVASLAVLGPNLAWNAAHDFATLSHTADNANLADAGFSPLHIFTYVQDQAAVFGPITLLVLLAGFGLVIGRKDKWTTTRELWLACFIAPPLLVILGQELISRAHANWAAAAYPAACVLVAAWLDCAFGGQTGRIKAGPFLKAGITLNVLVGVVFTLVWISPGLADATGGSGAMKGVRGWVQTTAQLVAKSQEVHASVIMLDDRELWHAIDYHGRNIQMPPLRAWQRGPTPRSHAEEEGKLRPGEDGAILIASGSPAQRPMIRKDFASIRELGYIDVPLTPKRHRVLKLYLASGYHQAPRTPEFEAANAGLSED